MSVVTRDILKAQLQRKEMHPVYTLFGPEAVLLKRAENIIADRSFSEGDFRDFNDTAFSLNNENAVSLKSRKSPSENDRSAMIFSARLSRTASGPKSV